MIKIKGMKKFGLIILGFFSLITCSIKASPVTADVAKSVAEAFCSKKGIRGDLSLSDVKREGCYFFNSSEDGFVIVAADDNITPILGYSKTGSINKNSKNVVAFTSWLNSIDEGVDSLLSKIDEAQIDKSKWDLLKSGNYPVSTRNSQSVAPLLSTKWSQYEPYNLQCPENCITGCVAVAMAQVMKFYNHPKKGVGVSEEYVTKTNNYKIPSLSFDTEYDWSNMLDDYNGPYSQEQADAVSKLIYHCGVSVFMDFDSIGSGAIVSDAAKALYEHFDYDRSIRFCRREHFTSEQWHSLLKEQLNTGYPIIYSGRDESSISGHSFVCDGYDEEGFYHFNFGWGGHFDGYFSLDFIVPVQDSLSGDISDYSFFQTAIINIFPNENGSYYYDFIHKDPMDFSISKDTIRSWEAVEIFNKISNLATENFEGELFMKLWDGDKNLLEEIYLSPIMIEAFASITFSSLKMNFSQLPNGIYYLSFKLRGLDGMDYEVRDLYDSVAWRKFVVDIPQNGPSVNFVYEWSDNFEVSPDTVLRGEYLYVDACIINVSDTLFKGTAYLLVCNSVGDTVGVLQGEAVEAGLFEGACLYWKFIIDENFAGNYYVEVVLLDDLGRVYTIHDIENSDNKRKFFVDESIPSAPNQCDFVCRKSSDFQVVVESYSDSITTVVIDYEFFNESNFNFAGMMHIDILNEFDRVVASLPIEELTVDSTMGYRGGLKLDLEHFPSGEYYMALRLEDAGGTIYRVNDSNCEIAKRIFTIGATNGYPLLSSYDNSLHVSVYDHQLNLYSNEKQEVVIYNLFGQVVKKVTVKGELRVELPSGSYLIRAKDSVIRVVL